MNVCIVTLFGLGPEATNRCLMRRRTGEINICLRIEELLYATKFVVEHCRHQCCFSVGRLDVHQRFQVQEQLHHFGVALKWDLIRLSQCGRPVVTVSSYCPRLGISVSVWYH